MLEKLLLFVSKYVPRRVRYWVLIDSLAKYTIAHPKANVPEVTLMDVVREFED